MMHCPRRERSTAFRDKEVRHPDIGMLELAEGAEFSASEWMEGGDAVFDALDMEEGCLQIQHVPL